MTAPPKPWTWAREGVVPELALGIDPGPERSAWVALDPRTGAVWRSGWHEREHLLDALEGAPVRHAAVEGIRAYQGRRHIGQAAIDTAVMVGRLLERICPTPVVVYRADVLSRLCGDPAAPKAKAREATRHLVARISGGPPPARIDGVKGHAWDALAVALCGVPRW